MVTRFGMSDALGNVDLASNHGELSTSTKGLIETEVRRLIDESYDRAKALITSHRKELDLLAHALLDYETLDKAEAYKVIKGEKLKDKLIMPAGAIKVPGIGPGPTGGMAIPGIPPIPGSKGDEGAGEKEPPAGGAVA